MSQYLDYTTISNQVKFEMSGQAPAEPKILAAVNAELLNLNTKYDIDTFKRYVTVSLKSDGKTEYEIDTIIAAGDVRKVLSLSYSDETVYLTGDIVKVDRDEFISHLSSGDIRNEFCVYFKNGKQYLRIITENNSSVNESFVLCYITSNLAIDSNGNFYSKITSGGSLCALITDTYLDLITLGCKKRLFYPSLGDADQTEVSITKNRYDSELSKLGLSDLAKTISRKSNKVKIRRQW